jgi:hypothetical protein
MFTFILIVISFALPLSTQPSSSSSFSLSKRSHPTDETSPCSDEGVTNSTSIICANVQEHCHSPKHDARKRYCNHGLKCMLKKDAHHFKCELFDEVNFEVEQDYSIYMGERCQFWFATVEICVVILMWSLLAMYLHNIYLKKTAEDR